MSTPIGWSNVIAGRAAAYFAKDGWNSLGDLSRSAFFQPYEDHTGYSPVNLSHLGVKNLKFPLRWQPQIESDGLGKFSSQVHVTPHLGSVKPLILTTADLTNRETTGPYKFPNIPGKLGSVDKRSLMIEAKRTLRVASKVSKNLIAEAYWWENKFYSLSHMIPVLTS